MLVMMLSSSLRSCPALRNEAVLSGLVWGNCFGYEMLCSF